MTNEEKQLLLKDISARSPFSIKIQCTTHPHVLTVKGIINNRIYHTPYFIGCNVEVSNHLIEDVKPYLRPMSSMTEEEQEEFAKFHCVDICPMVLTDMLTLGNESKMFDWLNAHHLDYRGLIDRGLALVALEGMYK